MILARNLEKLRETLWDYYGQQNEIRAQIKVAPEDVVEKPEALIRYEMSKELGIPYVDGGLMDQPFVWIEEHGVIARFLQEWDIVEKLQARTVSDAS
jgi:hypothetical protein